MKRSAAVDLTGLAVVAFFTIFDARENVPGTRDADALTYLLVGISIAALLFRRPGSSSSATRRRSPWFGRRKPMPSGSF